MKLSARAPVLAFLRGVQHAYVGVIRQGAPRVAHGGPQGPPGGSLARDVGQPDLVRAGRSGGSFAPSRLGIAFRVWWQGSSHQQARGRDVPLDVDRLVRALEDDLARQLEAEDRRSA